MSIYRVIENFKASPPRSEADAKLFLANITDSEAQQLIAALYIGREHIHCHRMRNDMDNSRAYTDHISTDEYARILYEKGESVVTYFDKLLACAAASQFDLDSL